MANLEQIRDSFLPRYDIAISGKPPAEFREFEDTSLEFEVLLSGDAREIVDDATITLEILDGNGRPLDSEGTFRAFVLPEEPVRVPPLSPEAPQRQVAVPIAGQRPGDYTIVARVSAGRHSSQTHMRVSVASRRFSALQDLAPAESPLLVLVNGIVRSPIPITELHVFRVLLPEYVGDLGYFNSTLWIQRTYIGAVGGDTWEILNVKQVGEITGELRSYEEAIKDPKGFMARYGESLEFLDAFEGGKAIIRVGDIWYELEMVDAQRIKFTKREGKCTPLKGVDSGEAPFATPSAWAPRGKKWTFDEAHVVIIEGEWDCGAVGRICAAQVEVNGKLYEIQDNINEAGHRFVGGFPLWLDLEEDRFTKVKVSVGPIRVELCTPPEVVYD